MTYPTFYGDLIRARQTTLLAEAAHDRLVEEALRGHQSVAPRFQLLRPAALAGNARALFRSRRLGAVKPA